MGINGNAEPNLGMILGLDTLAQKLQLGLMLLFSIGLTGSKFKDQ